MSFKPPQSPAMSRFPEGSGAPRRGSVGNDNRRAFYGAVIVCLTVIALLPVLGNSFTNWDDHEYVTGNALIHSLSLQNILRIFSPTTLVSDNYQPVTIVTYALNYAAGGLNPAGYILFDLIVHLLNIVLVFVFIRKLSGSDVTASFGALLFGIHPMHVESVAWISDRKDLLCVFFYLGSLLLYLSYLEKSGGRAALRYSLSFLSLILSLLSKSSAITLPAVLLLLDYYRGRKISRAMVIDKIPFIVPAVILGLWAIKGQHESIDIGVRLSVLTRACIACWSFMFYLIRFFVPVRLSAFYPYPPSLPAHLPLRYALSPLFVAASAGAAWCCRRSKTVMFGFGFFLVNVVFILHFIPVSSAVTADRFSYLASIGLSCIVARYALRGMEFLTVKSLRLAAAIVIGLALFAFGYGAHERCKVWKNSETLWNDVIGKYSSPIAYNNRGNTFYSSRDYARAIEDYTTALSQDATYADAYDNRGLAWDALGDHARAMADYDRAIERYPGFAHAYNNRGLCYYVNGNRDRAMSDFERAIQLDSGCAEAFYNRGNVRDDEGDGIGAVEDYSRALALNPEFTEAWYNRGRAYQALNDLEGAIACFTRTVELDTASVQALNSRGVLYCMRGDFDRALTDFNRAIVLQPLSADSYVNRGMAYGSKGDYARAAGDFSRALSLFPDPAKYPQVYFNRGRAYAAAGDLSRARADFTEACSLHFDYACREVH